jgi:hypothetical protein
MCHWNEPALGMQLARNGLSVEGAAICLAVWGLYCK